MKYYITIIFLLVVSSCSAQPGINLAEKTQAANAGKQSTLTKSVWFHGSPDCSNNKQPENDIYKHSEKTFIIRQNKCSTFEAPFIYVLVGADKVLVLDTGAIDNNPDYSLSSVVENLLGKDQFSSKEILVLHSHGHSDHLQGDSSFEELPNVKLIKPSETGKYLGFTEWPQGLATLELGDRQLKVIPTPGHQEEAITIYDPKTKWLLTGDTLYPGYIYVSVT